MIQTILLASMALTGYQETLYPEWGQHFSIDEMIYEEKTDYWDLAIFENGLFGKVCALDGIIQFTEKDEPAYHEMLAHVPLLTHPNPKSVLIVGGGDGGLLREVLRHENLEKIVEVEIDPTVVELSKTYFPSLSNGAYENPRAELIIQDATQYVKETSDTFDVILIDSTDPIGPAEALISSEFFADCKKILNSGGILTNQNGVPFLQKDELKMSSANRAPHFKHVRYYLTVVPTYVGGFMTLGWASDREYNVSIEELEKRLANIKGTMQYYTPEIHKASFALPQFIKNAE